MTIRISDHTGLSGSPAGVSTGSEAELIRLGEHFDRHHWARLPNFLGDSVLNRILRHLKEEEEDFSPVDEAGGTDLVLGRGQAAALMLFLVNDPVLFESVRAITRSSEIGFFNGHIYRTMPGTKHDEAWYDDYVHGNLVAMSINLSSPPHAGGVLRIRDRRSEEVLETVEMTGPGDAVLFRVDPGLEHMVTSARGDVARTTYAGWFQSGDDYGLARPAMFGRYGASQDEGAHGASTAPELVLFTAAYPFGYKTEPFLETELEVLAERFSRIYLLPSQRVEGVRRTPPNAELVEMDWLDEPPPRTKRRALVSDQALRVLLWTLRTPSDLRFHLASRTYRDILARNILKLRSLKRLVRERDLHAAIFYDYWFENSTLALALLRRSGAIATAISRAHRFDVYDDAWGGRPVPFRSAKARCLDGVFAISDFGAAYLEDRVPPIRGKVSVQRLGVRDPGHICPGREDAMPLVVTCSALIPRKRVHLVPEVLACLDRPVRWTHLGDGEERRRTEEAAAGLDSRVRWKIAGYLYNREVLNFYEWHHVDVLLSLSLSEGLPVSMMEAQSYGIPIVACAVGGVPEIVNEDSGILLAPDATPAEIAAGLNTALETGRFEPRAVRAAFRRRFEATANYNRFADALIELHDRALNGRSHPAALTGSFVG